MNKRTMCWSQLSVLLWGAIAVVSAASQSSAELDHLLSALQVEKTSNNAMQELLSRRDDPEAKRYLAARVPALLDQYRQRNDGMPDLVWGNEARVAGEFKIAAAAPILARRLDMLTSPLSGGSLGYNFVDRAADSALIRIGPPAVPFVIEVLKHGNPLQREIAAHVLRYIGTDIAWRALEEDLPGEKDPEVRHRIQEALGSRH